MNQNDRGLVFAARFLLALLFIIAGARKVLAFAGTVGYFAKLGLPMPEVAACISILIELGGGILLVFGYRQAIVALVMMVFTFVTALIGHQFWVATDPQAYAGQLNNFFKNIAICGGFLMVFVDARRARR